MSHYQSVDAVDACLNCSLGVSVPDCSDLGIGCPLASTPKYRDHIRRVYFSHVHVVRGMDVQLHRVIGGDVVKNWLKLSCLVHTIPMDLKSLMELLYL